MRTTQRLFSLLPLLVGGALLGCTSSSSGGGEPLGTGQARIILAAQGDQATTMHVTATNTATAAVVLDKSVDLQANGTALVDVALDQATYTIHVQAYDLGDSSKVIGSGDVNAMLQAGETTEVHLTSTAPAGGGSGTVSASVDMAPQIKDIKVTLATDATSLGAAGSAVITVDAVDPSGGSLSFFWSGLGVDGAVQGTSTLTISATAAAASLASLGSATVHLVVQDGQGVTTGADITFTGSGGCVVCGSSVTAQGSATETSGGAQACLSVRASCNASCDAALSADPTQVAAHLACTTKCGLDLASCSASSK